MASRELLVVVRKRRLEGASIAGWKQKKTGQMQKRPASPDLHLLDTLLKLRSKTYCSKSQGILNVIRYRQLLTAICDHCVLTRTERSDKIITSGGIQYHWGAACILVQSVQVDLVVSARLQA